MIKDVAETSPNEVEVKSLAPCLWCPEDAETCKCNDELSCGVENPDTCESCT